MNATNSTPTITTAQSYAAMLAREAIQTEPLSIIHSVTQAESGSFPVTTFIVEFVYEDTLTNEIKLSTFDGKNWKGDMS